MAAHFLPSVVAAVSSSVTCFSIRFWVYWVRIDTRVPWSNAATVPLSMAWRASSRNFRNCSTKTVSIVHILPKYNLSLSQRLYCDPRETSKISKYDYESQNNGNWPTNVLHSLSPPSNLMPEKRSAWTPAVVHVMPGTADKVQEEITSFSPEMTYILYIFPGMVSFMYGWFIIFYQIPLFYIYQESGQNLLITKKYFRLYITSFGVHFSVSRIYFRTTMYTGHFHVFGEVNIYSFIFISISTKVLCVNKFLHRSGVSRIFF